MIPHHNVPVSFSAMFNCLGQLYSETIQICSGMAFILLETNAWGNNAQVCKRSRPWGSTRVGGALCLLKMPFTGCLFLSLFPLCAYVVDSQKSCQIVMFPFISQYKSYNETQGSEPWVCSFMMSEKMLPIPRDRNRHFDTPRESWICPWPCSFVHYLFIQQNSSTL